VRQNFGPYSQERFEGEACATLLKNCLGVICVICGFSSAHRQVVFEPILGRMSRDIFPNFAFHFLLCGANGVIDEMV
jgi:hypothetical protein